MLLDQDSGEERKWRSTRIRINSHWSKLNYIILTFTFLLSEAEFVWLSKALLLLSQSSHYYLLVCSTFRYILPRDYSYHGRMLVARIHYYHVALTQHKTAFTTVQVHEATRLTRQLNVIRSSASTRLCIAPGEPSRSEILSWSEKVKLSQQVRETHLIKEIKAQLAGQRFSAGQRK